MVRRADDQWLDIVRWAMMAMVEAEELGVTSANADQMLAEQMAPKPAEEPEIPAAKGAGEDKKANVDAAVQMHRGRQAD